jgi:hypothetical protein
MPRVLEPVERLPIEVEDRLQRDRRPALEVPGPVHDAHPALPQAPLDREASGAAEIERPREDGHAWQGTARDFQV